MATGACGINCDVCRLNLLGVCTTCGSGTSAEARIKLATQERVLGSTCAILSCCAMNQNGYCLRDCSQFPCENHTRSHYPFGGAFLEMQQRRRKDWVPRHDPLGRPITIRQELWDRLDKKELPQLCALTQAALDHRHRLVFPFLDLDLVVDLEGRQILYRKSEEEFHPLDIPLLSLVVLTYFSRVDRLFALGKDLISTRDMDRGNYFTGEQALIKEPLLRKFSGNPDRLAKSALAVRAEPASFTPTSWALYPFPRLPVYYLFRDVEGGEEPRLSILFDRAIQAIFTPPMVWELVNLTNARLLCA